MTGFTRVDAKNHGRGLHLSVEHDPEGGLRELRTLGLTDF